LELALNFQINSTVREINTMKQYLINVLVIAYLAVGCGTTYEVGGPSADISLDELAQKFHRR